jgi:hypothetical protein
MRDPYQVNDPYRQNDPYSQKDPYVNRDPYANNDPYSNKNDPYLKFNSYHQSYQNQNIHKKLKFKDILFFTLLSLVLLIVYLFYF